MAPPKRKRYSVCLILPSSSQLLRLTAASPQHHRFLTASLFFPHHRQTSVSPTPRHNPTIASPLHHRCLIAASQQYHLAIANHGLTTTTTLPHLAITTPTLPHYRSTSPSPSLPLLARTAPNVQNLPIVGVILSGGPSSVYEPGSPHVHASVWEYIETNKLPVLGICYGMQELAHVFGGAVESSNKGEFGRAFIDKGQGLAANIQGAADALFKGVEHAQMWMSHGDKVTKLPDGFDTIATTGNSPHAAIANPEKKMFGLQFHPEVSHSTHGKELLRNFVVGQCGAPTDWNMTSIASEFIENVRKTVGETGHVIGAVSGGVDSSVAAVLLKKAIGDRFHAIMVDNGCLRKDEATKTLIRLKDHLGINLKVCLVKLCRSLYRFALLCIDFLYVALHCFASCCIALHCFVSICIALHCFALPCIALHCLALHCFASHRIALHRFASLRIALHRFASLCIALHHFASLFIALHRIASISTALPCFASYCIALHCFTSHCIA
jgi:GMP synthase (glutamine-hydrolysing) A subunit